MTRRTSVAHTWKRPGRYRVRVVVSDGLVEATRTVTVVVRRPRG